MSVRVVFMGTPEFAVPPLEALLDAGFEVAAVCTQPDRPKGRGGKTLAPPVKALAQKRGIPVLQYERIRRKEGVEALRALAPDWFVTAAFGQILSRRVLDIPRHGTVNVHASLLPAYRGPAPINWCLIEGEEVTGVTTMLTDEGIDTGDMLLSRSLAIQPEETADELSMRLSKLGAALLIETLLSLERGDCPRRPQDPDMASRHPMLEKEHGRIDWNAPALRVANLVRGVSPWPGAYTCTEQGVLKIWRARVCADPFHRLNGQASSGKPFSSVPGLVLTADLRQGLVVACGQGAVEILELQAPGGRRMTAADYLRGHSFTVGAAWGEEA